MHVFPAIFSYHAPRWQCRSYPEQSDLSQWSQFYQGRWSLVAKYHHLQLWLERPPPALLLLLLLLYFFTSKRFCKNRLSSICSERFCLNEVCLRSKSPSLWIKFWSRPSLTRKIYIHVEFEFVKDWFINPIQDGPFQGCSRMRGVGGIVGQKDPLSKMCYTYPKMMKLGSYTLAKEDPKNIQIMWHTTCVLLTSASFLRKWANFAISRNTDIDCVLLHNFYFFDLFLSLWRFFK